MGELIDLHTHTTYSDGDLTPWELLKLAKENNIGTIAITDHDSVLGVKTLLDLDLKPEDICFIPGIEFNAEVDKGAMHILGLGINVYNKDLNKRLNQLRDNSMNHFFSVLEQIKIDYNITFTYEEIRNLMLKEHNLGRPDIARLCVNNGYASNVVDAFNKYLVEANDKVRGRNNGISYEEIIDLILKSDGIPVLAHPQTLELNNKEFLILLKKLITCGLRGLEVKHSGMSGLEQNMYYDIAKEYDLLISAGTDYHGITVKPNIYLGSGINDNVKVKQLDIVDELHKNRRVY